jgi:phage protein D
MVIKSWCDLTIDGKVFLEDQVISISYTDKRGDESDSLSVCLLPNVTPPAEGAIVELVIFNDLDQVQDCGMFHVQSINRRNNKDLSFTATGVEFNEKQKKRNSQNYEATKLSSIVNIVGERLGHEVKFDAPDQEVESIYQTDETDIQFLKRISSLYDTTFSIKNDVLIFVARDKDDSPSYEVDASKCAAINIRKSTRPLYKSCTISYYDRKLGEKIQVEIDEGNPTLEINCNGCKTEEEANLKGKAKLANTQRGTVKGSFTTIGQELYAGTNLDLINTYKPKGSDEEGEDDGKYAIIQATHNYNRASGWTVSVQFENFKLNDKGKKK